eukprot:705983-Ditylum_brightwellii.AAC.1
MALQPPCLAIPGMNAGGTGSPMFPPNHMGAGQLGANNHGHPHYCCIASSGAFRNDPRQTTRPIPKQISRQLLCNFQTQLEIPPARPINTTNKIS